MLQKDIQLHVGAGVAPELQDSHVFFLPPAAALIGIGELPGSDGHGWTVADSLKRLKAGPNVFGQELDHNIRIAGSPQIAVLNHGKSADDETDVCRAQCFRDGVEGSGFQLEPVPRLQAAEA